METNNLILVDQFCAFYEIDLSFLHSLRDNDLIEIVVLEDKKYISNEQLKDLEQAIHFHYDLNINIEGIGVIYNLLRQIEDLQQELRMAKNKLRMEGI